ncbi:hypothetical protein NX059_001627 [Plenodomus lindquistii]|nr:hypothetical protein NX059_001627 [Plenodomus lindquistii]
MSSRYASAHKSPGGPGDARPTAHQIILDEQLQGKWSGRTVLITGTSSGLGIETAKALLDTGATVYCTARNRSKAKTSLGSLLDNPRAKLLELDLNSLASVRKCADAFLKDSQNLNILIANAGVMATPEGRTEDGHETQFGTNHLAHFLLIQLLLPTLVKSALPDFQSRVVILSSGAHRFSDVNFDDFNFEGNYQPWVAYGQSKTANFMTSTELDRRYGKQGVHGYAVHPGMIGTGLMKFLPEETLKAWNDNPTISNTMKSVEQGASTSVWAAASKDLEGKGGLYLEDTHISGKGNLEDWHGGYAPFAKDEAKEKLLWEKSLELVKSFLM